MRLIRDLRFEDARCVTDADQGRADVEYKSDDDGAAIRFAAIHAIRLALAHAYTPAATWATRCWVAGVSFDLSGVAFASSVRACLWAVSFLFLDAATPVPAIPAPASADATRPMIERIDEPSGPPADAAIWATGRAIWTSGVVACGLFGGVEDAISATKDAIWDTVDCKAALDGTDTPEDAATGVVEAVAPVVDDVPDGVGVSVMVTVVGAGGGCAVWLVDWDCGVISGWNAEQPAVIVQAKAKSDARKIWNRIDFPQKMCVVKWDYTACGVFVKREKGLIGSGMAACTQPLSIMIKNQIVFLINSGT